MKRIVETDKAPKAIGPYSQGIINDGRFLFTAGQIGLDPESGEMVGGGIETQTRRTLDNMGAVLEAGHSNFDRVVKVTIYLLYITDFATVNEIYKEYFPKEPPARSAIQVAALPKGALVEIECIAGAY